MSETQIRQIEQDLVDWVAASGQSVTHDAILSWAQEASRRYPPALVRDLVWRLVGEHRLAFTNDWRVVAAG